MGTDIHLHIEVKINGKWQHLHNPNINRNYLVFEKLAGVRGSELEAIAPPRGLPIDVTEMTKFDSDYFGGDGYSHSYITASEISVFDKWYKSQSNKTYAYIESDWCNCWLFGNTFARFTAGSKDYPEGLDDVRFVFWFDC